MPRPTHRTAARNYLPESRLEDLALRLRRLANHRGYVREEITSPLLLRFLPAPSRTPLRGVAETYASELRHKLKEADLDEDQVAYLILHAEQEMDIAHARQTG